ncbi:unnamed protein product [Rangifer tarandus platyrhynchus]|uniref:Uncharacterized protein n=1 Tax=Rangifer tarandus platyrhynchus TaxID=3082113 RepID=A0ABN8XIB5_RANTA|nr:unnamed protein product [Rangifer tarandus platyrhynchus]
MSRISGLINWRRKRTPSCERASPAKDATVEWYSRFSGKVVEKTTCEHDIGLGFCRFYDPLLGHRRAAGQRDRQQPCLTSKTMSTRDLHIQIEETYFLHCRRYGESMQRVIPTLPAHPPEVERSGWIARAS